MNGAGFGLTGRSITPSRRALLGGLASLTGAAALGPLQARAAATEVKLWDGWTGADNTTALDKVTAQYNASQSATAVNATAYDWDTLFSKWVISAATGHAPDIVLYHVTEIPEFAKRGMTIPLDGIVGSMGIDLGKLPPAAVRAVHWDDKLYAIPVDNHPLALYYNVELVEKAGLDPEKPPRDAETFLEWAKKLTVVDAAGNTVQYGVDMPLVWATARWFWFSLLYQYGGTFLDEHGKAAVDSEPSRKALQYIVDLIAKYKVANPQVGDIQGTQFGSKQVATRFVGPWEVNLRMAQKMHFGTTPLPLIGTQRAAWCNAHCLSLTKQANTSRQAASSDFIAWFARNFATPATTVGIIPLFPQARNSPEFTGSPQYPYYKAFIEELPYAVYEPAIPQYTAIFSFGKPTPLVTNLQAALTGSMSVADALKAMKQGIDAQLART